MRVSDLIAVLSALDPTDDVLLCVDGVQAHVERVRMIPTKEAGPGTYVAFVHLGDETCRTLSIHNHGVEPTRGALCAPDVDVANPELIRTEWCANCEAEHDKRAVVVADRIHDDSKCCCRQAHHALTVERIEHALGARPR
jgi:hypothetical protein